MTPFLPLYSPPLSLPPAQWFLWKCVKLVQKLWKSIQTSRRVNPVRTFQYTGPLHLGASPQSWEWETEDAENQCIKSVAKRGVRSTKNNYACNVVKLEMSGSTSAAITMPDFLAKNHVFWLLWSKFFEILSLKFGQFVLRWISFFKKVLIILR